MLTYHGKPVTTYDYYHSYNTEDYVIYDGVLYKSLQNHNARNFPDFSSSWFHWERIGTVETPLRKLYEEQKKEQQKKEPKMIRGDHIGNISGDNVVIYGDNTGNISANGEKSVVVVFGDVTGSITAEQVIRFDNSNMDAVKAMVLKERGKNNA